MAQSPVPGVLRLHLASDGQVWAGDDHGDAATVVAASPAAFFSLAQAIRDARSIRVLGTASNAELIYHLQRLRLASPESAVPVRIAAPAVVPTVKLRTDPVSVLHALWQPSEAASLPGLWTELTNVSFVPFLMIRQCLGRPHIAEVVRRVGRFHPAWPAFAFFGCDQEAACRLVCAVPDFRWYAHPVRPGRITRLTAHLGLTPRNAAAYLGQAPPDHCYERAKTVFDLWRNSQRVGGAAWLAGRFDGYADPVAGLLDVSRWLLRLVRDLWTAGVATHPDARFQADQAFPGEPAVAKVFEHFRVHWRPA